MVKITVYVEGGGKQNKALLGECRRAFSKLISSAVKGAAVQTKIIACGSRNEAYNNYCKKCNDDPTSNVFLLVDSEGSVSKENKESPWNYLKRNDNWDKPADASALSSCLMVEAMENWFLADVGKLETYYGKGFKKTALPKNTSIESVAKQTMLASLKKAAKETKKGGYSKGNHSFAILASIDGKELRNKSFCFEQFMEQFDPEDK